MQKGGFVTKIKRKEGGPVAEIKRGIVGVAVQVKMSEGSGYNYERGDELVISMARPARHCDLRDILRMSGADRGWIAHLINHHTGFVDERGRFLDRERAARYAVYCGQVKAEDIRANTLLSEDLW